MAGIIRSLQTLELRLDERLDRFISRYPHMAYPIIFFGMPVLVLTAVFFFDFSSHATSRPDFRLAMSRS